MRGRDRTEDNLAEYSDGHVYCFSCHYFKPADSRVVAHNKIKQSIRMLNTNAPSEKQIILPADCISNLGYTGGEWLASYDITKDEVLKDGIMWSPSCQAIIFPFYESVKGTEVKLIGWQARNFVQGRPKYLTRGKTDTICWYHGLTYAKDHGIILVEDCISAIKVGRQACTVPLLGSSLSQKKQLDLYQKSEKLIFWLDYDKVDAAYKYANVCALAGYETRVIVTKDDPKDYDDNEIKAILNGVGY